MIKRIAGITAAAAITVTALVLPAHASPAVNWRQRTCSAAQSYASHPSRARLERLVTDSFRVAPKYLGADVGQLYADVEGGGTKYLASDIKYIREDCAS